MWAFAAEAQVVSPTHHVHSMHALQFFLLAVAVLFVVVAFTRQSAGWSRADIWNARFFALGYAAWIAAIVFGALTRPWSEYSLAVFLVAVLGMRLWTKYHPAV